MTSDDIQAAENAARGRRRQVRIIWPERTACPERTLAYQAATQGCACPPGSEATCRGVMCPRRPVPATRREGDGKMRQPVDHILRASPPWREGASITECGQNGASVTSITQDEFIAKVKELGKQRLAMFTCMTCIQTVDRWCRPSNDLRHVLQREIEWETLYGRQRGDRGRRLLDELEAIVSLVANHRDEFLSIIEANDQRREWLEKKAALKKKPPPRRAGPALL